MGIPAAIIFVNDDLTVNTRTTLQKQLFITDTMDGYTYDGYVSLYPEWPAIARLQNRRVMVVRPFSELQNRTDADVVIFVTHATAAIEKNKYGPPGATYRVAELHWGKLCVFDLSIYNSS